MARTKAGSTRRLVVGGGRALARQVYDPEIGGYIEVGAFPRLKPRDVALNLDPEAQPYVIGDIKGAPFANAVFSEVYFEKVAHEVFTSRGNRAIREAARIMEVNGRLIIETGPGVPLEPVKEALRQAGFRNLRVARKGFIRITGRRGE